MPVLAFAGGETGSITELINPSNVAMESTVVRSGRWSFRFPGPGAGTLVFPAQSGPVFFRGYFRFTATPSGHAFILSFEDAAAVAQVNVFFWAGTTTLAVQNYAGATYSLSPNIWHRIELLVWYAGSVIELRINGAKELAFATAIGNLIGRVTIGGGTGPGTIYWDDLHITTDDWPGPGYIIARQGRPQSATPSYNAFAKTGGVPIEDVWSATPVDISVIAQSTTFSQTQTMRIEKPSELARGFQRGYPAIHEKDRILACRIGVFASQDAGVSDHYFARVVSGALTLDPLVSTAGSWLLFQSPMFLPANLQELDACEIGAARGAGATNLYIADAWMLISVADEPRGMQHFTGLETGSTEEIGPAFGATAISSAVAHTGTYSLQVDAPGSQIRLEHPLPLLDHARWDFPMLYMSAYVYFAPLGNEGLFRFFSSGRVIFSVLVNPAGQAFVLSGVTTVISMTAGITASRWVHFEVGYRAAMGSATGQITLRVDGQELSAFGILSGAITGVAAEEANGSNRVFIDDIVFDDSQWPGAARVIARQGISSSDVSVPVDTGWTITGGTTIQEVWSNTPANGATAAYAPVSNTAQTMPIAPVSAVGPGDRLIDANDMVLGCRIVAYTCLFSGSGIGGPHALRLRVPTGTPGPTIRDFPVSLGDAITRPHTSPIVQLTPNHLDAVQIGGAQGGGALSQIIHEIWLMVAYAELERDPIPLPSVQPTVALARITAQVSPLAPTHAILLRHQPSLYFRFTETWASTIFKDSSGWGRNGLKRGTGFIFCGGPYGGALPNDPDNRAMAIDISSPAYVEVAHAPEFNSPNFTIQGWFMQYATNTSAYGIFEKTINGTFASSYRSQPVSP